MNESKMDQWIAQDLYHYALAMQGNGNSTFPSTTLVERLDASRSAQDKIHRFGSALWQQWDEVMPRTDSMRSTEDLSRVGAAIQAKVEAWAQANNIDANAGEVKPPEPVEDLQTRIYRGEVEVTDGDSVQTMRDQG